MEQLFKEELKKVISQDVKRTVPESYMFWSERI